MPPKVRELVQKLEEAGFRDRGGKGSHRKFVHPHVPNQSPCPVNLEMMPSSTKSALWRRRLRSQKHEGKCKLRQNC